MLPTCSTHLIYPCESALLPNPLIPGCPGHCLGQASHRGSCPAAPATFESAPMGWLATSLRNISRSTLVAINFGLSRLDAMGCYNSDLGDYFKQGRLPNRCHPPTQWSIWWNSILNNLILYGTVFITTVN